MPGSPGLANAARIVGPLRRTLRVGSRRASGPWTPASLPNLVAWFDAQDSATITQATAIVSNWANKKTGGGDASQATSGKRPTYSATAINSKPGIVFAAGKALATGITVVQPFSIGMVVTATSLTNNRPMIGTSQASTFNGIFSEATTGGIISSWGGSQWWNGNVAVNTPVVVANTVNGASSLLTNNGGTKGAANTGANGMATMTIGEWAGVESWVGPIGEVVVGSAAWGTSDRQKLEGYLAWKWGLQASLAAGHPYLSAAP
jgi:hypothetical protein